MLAKAEAPGDHRRPRRALPHGRGDALAEQLGAPVITTFKAKGQIGDDHPLAAGVLGRSGTPVASWVMNEADLLLVLGASFSNHTGIYAGHPIIQVDFDPMQLGKFHAVEVPVWGEIGVAAELLAPSCLKGTKLATEDQRAAARRPLGDLARREGEPRGRRSRQRGQLGLGLRRDGATDPRRRRDRRRRRQPRLLLRPLLRVLGLTARADVRLPRLDRVRLPGGDGRVGRGQAGRPIVAVTGDGGFAQYMAELTTAVKHNMNITHVLLNNGQLGKICKEQRRGGVGGVADRAPQPRLLEVTRATVARSASG